jgi:BirA family biotin operon repressor/biotin-[acetyl-CoA-carboxylase] ligase
VIEDILSEEIIMEGLETRLIGKTVVYYSSVTSTNDVAREQARKGAEEGTVVIADEQIAGKGRLKRNWIAPSGNIALSVILYPEISMLPSLVMVASLAVVRGIEAATGLKPGVKWPNDILIDGKKACGILIENDLKRNRVNHSIIGIGINIKIKPEDIPDIHYPVTSLSAELGSAVSRAGVIRCLLVEMEKLYLTLSQGGSVFGEWCDNLVTLGKKVRVTSGETVYEGVAESVAADGSLMLRTKDGELIPVVAGDVSLSHY